MPFGRRYVALRCCSELQYGVSSIRGTLLLLYIRLPNPYMSTINNASTYVSKLSPQTPNDSFEASEPSTDAEPKLVFLGTRSRTISHSSWRTQRSPNMSSGLTHLPLLVERLLQSSSPSLHARMCSDSLRTAPGSAYRS